MIEIKKLKEFTDTEGKLFETLRCDDTIFEGRFGQNLVSIVNPGIIKGLHLHERQTDYTTCVSGDILYVAVDVSDPASPKIERVEIGDRNRVLVKTPPGLWHGYMSLNNKPAIVLYTMDKPYDPADPDTKECDPLSFGDVWKL
jgi:dTDP-4-dehydrorhamnose 3,5-epimerase